jgi:nucleotide-binding universal stress UspA family protein
MIILGMHREDAFKDMFRGTTAERTIRASHVPVLLVKDQATSPYRRIIVGVDFSVYSRRAVEFAVKFAPTGQFHLVHAYDVPFKGFLSGQDTRREISKEHEAQFRKMVEEEMATFLSGVEANAPELERIIQPGLVHDVIHRQVDRLKPDLLVVGTHGRTGVAHAFLGSVAEDLLRNPPCDVLAVTAW